MSETDSRREYDVCLSFAGEQREYVEEVADELRGMGVRVFYDDYEMVSLWGKNLYDHLDWVYSKSARYCIVFVSSAYERKVWTNHERRSAQERALRENDEYILPVIFDETRLPGLPTTISYVDARKIDATELAQLVRSKLGPIYRWKYLPDNPDRLFDTLEITNARERKACVEVAKQFIESLSSATLDERMFVFHAFTNKCPHDALTDPHVILDYLRRTLEKTSDEVVAVAKGLSPLGFVSRLEGHGDAEDVLHFRWVARMTFVHEFLQEYAASMSTKIALEMIDSALPHLCDDCMAGLASHLDFTALDEGAGGRIVLAEDWWQNVLSDPD